MDKIFGTTMYICKKKYNVLRCNEIFELYTFQDTITKLHVLAVIYNSLEYLLQQDRPIPFRIHSSCITSEMIGSLDCDCVLQLNKAFEYFIEHKIGILFYLVQEGRGCGYLGKARACQMVQYSEFCPPTLTTFEAYKILGMKPEYRSYHNIYEIISLLKLHNKEFHILTNNPDKINGISQYNINVSKNIAIEFEPNFYNKSYLVSKEAYGHTLTLHNNQPNHNDFNPYQLIHEPIKPFKINNVFDETTFHVASYYLPIQIGIQDKFKVVWFNMNLFFDAEINCEFIHLQCHSPLSESKKQSVYYHQENIIERLPILDRYNHSNFAKNLTNIYLNGGSCVLFSNHNYGILENKDITKVHLQSAKKIFSHIDKFHFSLLIRIYDTLENKLQDFCLYDNNDNENTCKKLNITRNTCVSGIGSSRFHAKYFAYVYQCIYVDFECLSQLPYDYPNNLVLISQGINPTILDYIQKNPVTACIHGNRISQEKRDILKKYNVTSIEFLGEIFDNTLARITGVFSCFVSIHCKFNKRLLDEENKVNEIPFLEFKFHQNKNLHFIFLSNELWIGIIPNIIKELYAIPIGFVGHCVEFIHGNFQSSLAQKSLDNFYFVFGTNELYEENIIKLFETCECNYFHFKKGNIIQWLKCFFRIFLKNKPYVHQINWNAKDNQHILYNSPSV